MSGSAEVSFGFMYYGQRTVDPDLIVDLARHVEASGYTALWVPEHQALYPRAAVEMARHGLALDYTRPHPDSLQVLALVAAVTERLCLESFLILPCHHPVVLAKQLATLDVLSRGRVRLCAGVGDLRREIEACGVDYRSRGRVADECIDVMRLLWATDPRGASYEGEFFSLKHMVSYPQPYQRTAIPIDIGGASGAAIRRAGTRGDGFCPSYTQTHEGFVASLDAVREVARQAGRDPASLELSRTIWLAETPSEAVEESIALGVTRFVCMAKMLDLSEIKDHLSALAEEWGLRVGTASPGHGGPAASRR